MPKRVWIVGILAGATLGCNAPPVPPSSASPVNGLAATLRSMTPEQRRQYFVEHPRQASAALFTASPAVVGQK